jgi:hypothetical protein
MPSNPLRLDTPAGPHASEEAGFLKKALFYVVGDADPSLLPRIIGPVTKHGLVPSRVHASNEDGDGAQLTVDLRLTDVPQTAAERIEGALRCVVGVRQVIAVYE